MREEKTNNTHMKSSPTIAQSSEEKKPNNKELL